MKGHLFNIYFFLTLGPPLPKAIWGHSVVEIQGDAFFFGGSDGDYNSAIYRLTCSAGICGWSTLNQKLKVARNQAVMMQLSTGFSCNNNLIDVV